MRICLVSSYFGFLDEGAGNVAFYLHKELSKRHEVLHLVLTGILFPSFWKDIKNFESHVIHYVPGISIKSLLVTEALKFRCCGAKVIISVAFPRLSSFSRNFVPLLKPDLVLTQSYDTERMFTALGCKTKFLPFGGVDIKRFTPVSQEQKKWLREKYGLDREKFTILHVGPIVEGRGLEVFNEIAEEENSQIILVASTTVKAHKHLLKGFKTQGCIVQHTYLRNIEEIYMLSDCYIFPTRRGSPHAIELPLSVLEAMACNLPVISNKFGALTQVFKPGHGLFFVDKKEDFCSILEVIRQGIEVKTREKVLPFSWERVVSKIEETYRDVVSEGRKRGK